MELKIKKYIAKAKSEIVKSIKDEYTPHETALSFAIGTFIVLVPTSATGLLILGAIAVMFDNINRIALFSTAVVFNPVVNIGFYALSYLVGSTLLGNPRVPNLEMFWITETISISQSLIVGSILTALAISLISYLLVYRISMHIQTTQKA